MDEVEAGRQTTMLDVIIDRLRGYGTAAHQVWLPPLDVAPTLDSLLGELAIDERFGLIAPAWRRGPRLTVPVGIEDRPYEQRRDPLRVALDGAGGNVVIVGGPRAGKSTLLRTLICSLALTHSPREVQFMCLDFGGGALRALAGLPHMSGVAVRRDLEAVRRTVAEVLALVEDREVRFAELGIESIDAYRDRRARGEFADDPFGDVFLIVDGYGLLREEQEDLDAALTGLVGRCLGFGVHVIITAVRWGEIRFNVRELYGTRLELRLGDPTDSEIDRKAAANVPTGTPGRGLSRDKLHVLSAMPRIDGKVGDEDLPTGTANLVEQVRAAWPHDPAPRVRLLPRQLPVTQLWELADQPPPAIPIGINETHLAPVYMVPETDNHLIVFGDAECGKTNLLRLIAKSIATRQPASDAKMVVVDYRRTLLGAVSGDHVLEYVPSVQVAENMAQGMRTALAARLPGPDITTEQLRDRSWWDGPEVFFLIDDYDMVTGSSNNPLLFLSELLPQARDIGLHVIIARRSGGASRALYDPLIQRMRELDSPALVMSGNRDEGVLAGNVRPSQQPPGRGVMVRRRDGVSIVQTALFTEPG
jgi:S-DNA-T family DNA segregation ATPase FtsK/SpoIIIE